MVSSFANDMGGGPRGCSGSAYPAVILAGGRATRMGGVDKPLLLLRGRPVLAHILDRLRPQVGAVALNANGDPARFAAWGLPVLADTIEGQPGPLAGVLAAMLWARPFAERVLTVPGDTPFLPPNLACRLAAAAGDVIALAASGGRAHPVVALWPVALADALARDLAERERRVLDWAMRQGAQLVAFPVEAGDPFGNLNTPNDLSRAAESNNFVW